MLEKELLNYLTACIFKICSQIIYVKYICKTGFGINLSTMFDIAKN